MMGPSGLHADPDELRARIAALPERVEVGASVNVQSVAAAVILGDLEHPIVQAPMGGGPSTPELAAAVGEAGGLGFLAAGYRAWTRCAATSPRCARSAGGPFGVNLFAPPGAPGDPGEIARYAQRLRGDAERRGVALGEPRHDDDGWEDKLALSRPSASRSSRSRSAVPTRPCSERLREAGCATWVTVTTPEEAAAATRAGADGARRPGRRGGRAPRLLRPEPAGRDRPARVAPAGARRDRACRSSRPAGIADRASVEAVLAAGASAAQLGTAFMLTPEAGTADAHRRALHGDAPTVLTRAFTGRPARGIENRFIREHEEAAPLAYPEVHHLTAPLRAAARAAGDPDGLHLWAGQAYGMTRELAGRAARPRARRSGGVALAAHDVKRDVGLVADDPRVVAGRHVEELAGVHHPLACRPPSSPPRRRSAPARRARPGRASRRSPRRRARTTSSPARTWHARASSGRRRRPRSALCRTPASRWARPGAGG